MVTAYRISVIIPNRNSAETIGLCLEALFASTHDAFEVIVVDDGSTDDSVAIINHYPCTLLRLRDHCGTAAARNRGARISRGSLLFFIDADCLVEKDTLAIAERAAARLGPDTVLGGSYTLRPHDQGFFSMFQSAFIRCCELKDIHNPNYVAGHAMVVPAPLFRASGGFAEDVRPILEDVEYSHRLRRQGYRLVMEPGLQVRHIFNFTSLADSLRNGYRKSRYWTTYSLGNRDLLANAGTASQGLKFNTLVFALAPVLTTVSLSGHPFLPLSLLVLLVAVNLAVNRAFLAQLHQSGGFRFLVQATLYYTMVYPLAVAAGGLTGLADYFALTAQTRTGRRIWTGRS